jgi:hypothetical protein
MEAWISLERLRPSNPLRGSGRRGVGSSPGRLFRPETLHLWLGLNQRAVDRKMIRADQTRHPQLRQCCALEPRRDVALKQALAVL